MKIRVSNSLFVILVSAVLWQPVSAAADSYDPPARVARLSYSRGSVSFQPAGEVGRRLFQGLSKIGAIPRAREILDLAGSHRPERIIYEDAKAAWNSGAINRQQCFFRQRRNETPV
jgi:hypothetical protein